jgi:hypothetical protein
MTMTKTVQRMVQAAARAGGATKVGATLPVLQAVAATSDTAMLTLLACDLRPAAEGPITRPPGSDHAIAPATCTRRQRVILFVVVNVVCVVGRIIEAVEGRRNSRGTLSAHLPSTASWCRDSAARRVS